MACCYLCRITPKSWEGDDRRCAFGAGVFSADNWNCETMNRLRGLAVEGAVYSNDQYCGSVPYDGSFIVLGWYKNRGRTEAAALLSECTVSPVSLVEAEECLSLHGRFVAP